MEALQPQFAEDRTPILLNRSLTAIGCDEPPFAGYPETLRAELSERHARIIRENGGLYLVALDGMEQIRINDTALSDGAAPLALGDVVRLGERLVYAVGTVADEAATTRIIEPRAGRMKLLLLPKSDQGPAAPIAVSEFPFLVAKSDGHFASYEEECEHAFGFLSRRHAHVFRLGDALYVEDLGSTNGTRVNGEMIGKTAVRLTSGDEVVFGHPSFTFEVALIEEDDTVAQEDPEGTVLITSAGSFLDIYCDSGADEADDCVPLKSDDRNSGAQSLLDRLRLAWFDLPISSATRTWVTCAVVALAVVAFVGVLLVDDRLEEAGESIADGEHEEALMTAADYLRDHPDDDQGRRLLGESFEHLVVPRWTERMLIANPTEAQSVVDEALRIAPMHAEHELPRLLKWVGSLYEIAGGDKQFGAVSVAYANDSVQNVLNNWDANVDRYTRLLRRLADAHADFAELRADTLSRLRTLQADSSRQLEAVRELQARLDTDLQSGRYANAVTLLERFREDHPAVLDAVLLQEELERFVSLAEALAAGDLNAYLDASEAVSFTTLPFASRADGLLEDREAALSSRQLLVRAGETWARGELAQAVQMLGEPPASSSRWQKVVEERRVRYADLLTRFNTLLDVVQTPEYPGRLIAFFGDLNSVTDQFMFSALEEDFWSQKARALEEAHALSDEAAGWWADYQDAADGIGGGLRLEREVSDAYRQQAGFLMSASTAMNRSLRLYRLLEEEVPEEAARLADQIALETRRQRNAIDALRTLLDSDVVSEKLSLLPEVAS